MSATRDPQALALLQAAANAMGGVVPNDSVATGTVTVVAGSENDQGTVRILTRGTDQTSVQVTTQNVNWTVVYSKGQASRAAQTAVAPDSQELASTSQSAYFPLALIGAILQNSDAAYQYIGGETLDGVSVQHVKVWNTFQSNPSLEYLSRFTVRDIWLDSSSGLPRRIAYIQRDGGGAAPRIPVTIDYTAFQNFGGILYPTQVQQTLNGTPWMTIAIGSASFNTGLTDADFPVAVGGN